MERTATICGQEIRLKSTAASLISYKRNFGRDGLKDMISMSGLSAEHLDSLDVDTFLRFLWVFAKAATPSIPPMEEWLDGFDANPIDFVMEAVGPVGALIASSAETSVRPKN